MTFGVLIEFMSVRYQVCTRGSSLARMKMMKSKDGGMGG